MKMPMNWAKEFAEFECTPQEFADRMTMSGSKVETYECEADGIKNVVVGKILEIVPHPDSDHMVVCQVDVGRDAPVQIVTGANNLKVGDLVPAALHVAKLPGGKRSAGVSCAVWNRAACCAACPSWALLHTIFQTPSRTAFWCWTRNGPWAQTL